MNVAIVVAHPDDEIIWCGGLILQHPRWDWTVLSLSRADDADRCPKFYRVCEHLGVKGFISDLNDSSELEPINTRREIGDRVAEHLASIPWDICITHGANGEYGHQRHKETHIEILDLIRDGILECGELWTFAYDCDAQAKICEASAQADIIVELSENDLQEKRRIIRDMYGYGEDSFEFSVCISPEGLRRWKFPEEE